MSEEGIAKHFKECGPTMENIHTALASAQKRLKGNTVLQRQVMNLKRCNWSLRRMLQISKNADEHRTIIDRLYFCLLKCGTDFFSPCHVSCPEVGTLAGTHVEIIRRAKMDTHLLPRKIVCWRHDSLKKGVLILEIPATT